MCAAHPRDDRQGGRTAVKPKQNTDRMECAGSLAPELEGSARSESHAGRFVPPPAAGTAPKAPAGDRGEPH